MPKLNIKLGRSFEDMITSPAEMKDEIHYPSFHIQTDEKLDLPHEGTMTIQFRKTGFAMREDSDGETSYSCDVEVHKIISAYPEEDNRPSKRDKSTEEALDNLAAEQAKEKEKDNDNDNDY